MTAHLGLPPHRVTAETRGDGTVVLASGYAMGPVARCSGDWLDHWAKATPDAVFLAERSGAGWRVVSYAEARDRVRAIAGHLASRGMGAHTPILILSGNGIDHGLLTLAAQYIGVPTVPVAEQYALLAAAHGRLVHAVRLVRPHMVFAADADRFGAALSLGALAGIEVVASVPGASGATPFETLLRPGDAALEEARAAVGPDTVAKILLTSGSTSDPKGVLTTQGMMCANQAQIADALPFLRTRPPRIVDWLPWNHVFGGSYNFNLMLANGGSLYIDDGKPVPGLFERTLENLGLVSGTISFNVPVGFAQLVAALRRDAELRQTYFADLDMIFYAGASLPQETWAALEDMAAEAGAATPLITTSWGLTETAPGVLLQHEPGQGVGAGVLGVPMTGQTVKLVPVSEGRYEARVKGPNVTPGYVHDPARTAAAFDEEGYFITGDAMRFVDAEAPARGLRFDGRLSEDFKLATGTWVRASDLRLALLRHLSPLAADVILTGEGRDAVGALIVPNMAALAAADLAATPDGGALAGQMLQEAIAARLAAHATEATGSAARVVCALVLAEPPSMGEGEMTAKGNLNFARILERRAALVARLYDARDPARIGLSGQ